MPSDPLGEEDDEARRDSVAYGILPLDVERPKNENKQNGRSRVSGKNFFSDMKITLIESAKFSLGPKSQMNLRASPFSTDHFEEH